MFDVAPGIKLILGSSSPRRRELLGVFGFPFEVRAADVDETVLARETPREMVERLALLKAETVARGTPSAWVLGADTTVTLHGEILGKPIDAADASGMLLKLQGTTHEVWSSIALVNIARGVRHVESHRSSVTMRPFGADVIRSYIACGEPMDKAGSYALQGIGACLVKHVEGSFSNVIGLDLAAVTQLLQKHQVIVPRNGSDG